MGAPIKLIGHRSAHERRTVLNVLNCVINHITHETGRDFADEGYDALVTYMNGAGLGCVLELQAALEAREVVEWETLKY